LAWEARCRKSLMASLLFGDATDRYRCTRSPCDRNDYGRRRWSPLAGRVALIAA